MKKLMTLSGWLVMAAAITLATTACSSDDNIVEEPMNPTTAKTYHMSLTASKGDGATTRALSLNGKTLNATWATGDKVYVFNYGLYVDDNYNKKYVLGGYLEAKSDGTTVTLDGDLTGTVETNDILQLAYPQLILDYTGQDGTLTKIASTYDYTCGLAKVTDVTTSGNITAVDYDSEAGPVQFGNGQAIVKFTLQDQGGNDINATSLTISAKDGSSEALTQTYNLTTAIGTNGPITITLSPATNVIYAALSPEDYSKSLDCTLTATDGTNTYTYTKSNVKFEYGKYYEITVKMKKLIDLSNLTGNYEAQNGDVLTGTLDGTTQPYKISIADGATVTLDGVTINGVNNNSYTWAGINCEGNATIILKDGTTNVVKGFKRHWPGIYIAENKTLIIQGNTGTLAASPFNGGGNSGSFGAGIGGGGYSSGPSCGNIVIEGGVITATGGQYAPGIGCGTDKSCGNITISGGTVTAYGNGGAAGIGSGNSRSSCGNITISGTANVTASCASDDSGKGGAGIGSGYGSDSHCGDINISTSGIVTAMGGTDAAGIGSGRKGSDDNSCGNISITGGTITAEGKRWGAGIGSGYNAQCGTITIGSGIIRVSATSADSDAKCIGAGLGGTCGKVSVDPGLSDNGTDSNGTRVITPSVI